MRNTSNQPTYHEFDNFKLLKQYIRHYRSIQPKRDINLCINSLTKFQGSRENEFQTITKEVPKGCSRKRHKASSSRLCAYAADTRTVAFQLQSSRQES